MADPLYPMDTSAEAQAVQLELIRAMRPAERALRALRLTCQVRRQAKDAIGRRYPNLSEEELAIKFIELHYGTDLAQAVQAHRERNCRERRE